MNLFVPEDELLLLVWLKDLLESGEFDIVISVERKATAVLRALLDLTDEVDCRWNWDRVLSSDALPYLPPNWLNGQRILVFNEMIHRGSTTLAAIEAIKKNSPGAEQKVRTAAFFVHEKFDSEGCWSTRSFRDDASALSPDHAIRRGVPDRLYSILRARLIAMLRFKGALLLDTEHIESTFTYTLSHRRFLEALCVIGMPIEYESEGTNSFPGVTVCDPVVAESDELKRLLPDGSDVEASAPRKVRIVRRGPKEFALIPIWYPPVPVRSVLTPCCWSAPSYLRPTIEACPAETLPELSFHLASLVAGVQLLRSVWAGLRPHVGKGIEPQTLSGSVEKQSPLGHLRALYPLINFDGLQEAMSLAISAHNSSELYHMTKDLAEGENAKKSEDGKKSGQKRRPAFVAGTVLQHECLHLLTEILRRRSHPAIAEPWLAGRYALAISRKPEPFTWHEFWETGRDLGIPETVRSVIMDAAIDDAILKTSHLITRRQGQSVVVRAFEPDSEFAKRALERVAHGAEEVPVNAW